MLILHKLNFSEDEKTCIFLYLKEIGQANKICLADGKGKGKVRENPQCIIELKREKLVNLIETQLNMQCLKLPPQRKGSFEAFFPALLT